MLGNIQFIGQLYKKKMLTERIMHECIRKLLEEVGTFPSFQTLMHTLKSVVQF